MSLKVPEFRSISHLSSLPQYEFHLINGRSRKMTDLQNIFKQILEPLYGPQADALKKIALSRDRKCYLLCENDHPVGVIAFKTLLSDEFQEYGISNSIEIKSLFVVDSENNSGKGLGTTLLNKAYEETDKLKIDHSSFHVTVSETKSESLNFFKKKGFRINHQWNDKYQKGVSEYLLSRSVHLLDSHENPTASVTLIAQKITGVSSELQGLLSQEKTQYSPQVFLIVKDAHWDDIHALKLLADGTIVSGSKDNSLCKWSQNGELVRVINEVEPVEIDSRDWITAIGILNDEYWISGERNGRVSLWNTEGDFIKNLNQKLPKQGHVSHEYNSQRVNCVASGINKQKLSFFTGFPTMFDEYNVIEGRTTSSTKVHNNDWVFCIHPLTEKRILVVTAGILEVWEKSNREWQRGKILLQERRIAKQRPFISSLTALKSSPNHFGLGVFGGDVRVFDIEQEKIVNQWSEHQKRVWTVENVSQEIFASSAEDRLIKFWDIRLNKSICTLNSHIGQTHAMLSLNDKVLVAGSSQDSPLGKNEGAQLVFYDTRK